MQVRKKVSSNRAFVVPKNAIQVNEPSDGSPAEGKHKRKQLTNSGKLSTGSVSSLEEIYGKQKPAQESKQAHTKIHYGAASIGKCSNPNKPVLVTEGVVTVHDQTKPTVRHQIYKVKNLS